MSPKLSLVIALAMAVAVMSMWQTQASSRRRATFSTRELRQSSIRGGEACGRRNLTASITHEIYQPLSAILTNVDAGELLWKQSPLPTAELRNIFDDIRHDVQQVSLIVGKLRALLTHRTVQLSVLDLNEIVASARRVLLRLGRHYKTRVHFHLAGGLSAIMGDGTQLEEVLINLATNAMEAMSVLPPSQRRLKVVTQASGDAAVALILSDSGPGISESNLSEIFEAFHSTKPGGMGMGLAIVRTIVEVHGGVVDVESTEAGTVFRVEIPTTGNATERPVGPGAELPR